MMTVLLAIKSFFATAFIFIFSLVQIITPITLQKNEDSFFESWSANQAYTADYAINMEKEPNKDFVVLNLTDIQLSAYEPYMEPGKVADGTIAALIEEKRPDLITVTGDNAWSITAYLRMIQVLESTGIPWAPVMGNHDGQGCPSEFWCAYRFSEAKNCLFKFGPKDMGYGNYIINITENGHVIHSLFMMDTHSGCHDTDAGTINRIPDDNGGYDHFWSNQIEWYRWAVKGIEKLEGKTVESSVFCHIPCVEYWDAMRMACDVVYVKNEKNQDVFSNSGKIKDEYKDNAFGMNLEPICSPPGNNGWFDVAKELGSTKNVIVGHDHTNSLSVEYEGIRLSYGLKCGMGCYWNPDSNGGSYLDIDNNGKATFSHMYINPDDFSVK